MTGNIRGLINTKILLLILAALLVFGGAYTIQQQARAVEQPKDIYKSTIESNSDAINNAVIEMVKTEGPAGVQTLKYRVSCEDALGTIRGQNMEAERGYSTLSQSQKYINVKYRAFLHEAADVLVTCENGGSPDITKMSAAKNELY